MAALLLLTSSPADCEWVGRRIGIFPGGPTPAMFPAEAPFWIGYGFVSTADDPDEDEPDLLSEDTRFELDVDGGRVPLLTDLQREGEGAMRKTDFVEFASGLPAGWHEFAGRWYDRGSLILTSRATIEFVESERPA